MQQPNSLLLDTNLLLLLLIGGKDTRFINISKTLKKYLIEDYIFLVNYIESKSFQSLITTPHILTEVSTLLGKEREDIQYLGREALGEFIEKCEEKNYPAIQVIQDPAFLRLGLTDTVIAIASQLSTLVLTADAPLYHHVATSGGVCINFNHLRQGAWGDFPL